MSETIKHCAKCGKEFALPDAMPKAICSRCAAEQPWSHRAIAEPTLADLEPYLKWAREERPFLQSEDDLKIIAGDRWRSNQAFEAHLDFLSWLYKRDIRKHPETDTEYHARTSKEEAERKERWKVAHLYPGRDMDMNPETPTERRARESGHSWGLQWGIVLGIVVTLIAFALFWH